jgi:hypothetical protein
VVLTSSFAAIGYGQPPQSAPFNETNWTYSTSVLLGWVPRSSEEAIVATAQSLLQLGLLKKSA